MACLWSGRQRRKKGRDSNCKRGEAECIVLCLVMLRLFACTALTTTSPGFFNVYRPIYSVHPVSTYLLFLCASLLPSATMTYSGVQTESQRKGSSPASFCGKCLHFYREKGSAVLIPSPTNTSIFGIGKRKQYQVVVSGIKR